MAQFPPELFEKIFSELSKDRRTLKACALASRHFTNLSHQHLFRHVLIRSPQQSDVPLHKIGGSASQFEDLLKSSPHIAGYVRCLELFDWPSWYNSQNRQTASSHWLPNDSHLHHCLPLLEKLEALVMTYRYITSRDWKELPAPLLLALYDILRLPSLRYLDIEGPPTLSLLHVAARNVKHLTLYNASEISSDIENLAAHNGVVFIESLHITHYCVGTIRPNLTDLLPSNVSMRKLKKLLLDMRDTELDFSYEILERILQELGQSLEELIILPNSSRSWSADENSINLGTLKALKRLRVRIEYEKQPYEREINNIPWFIIFLKKSSGFLEHLETLDIAIYYEPDPSRTVVNWLVSQWNDLGEVLLNPKLLPSLKTVRMNIACSEMQNEIWQATKLSNFVKTMQSSTIGFDLQYGLSNQVEFYVLNPEWCRSLYASSWLYGQPLDEAFI
ncbi:hypothetical protein CPB83DRAFT_857356 [Crepidotus variabilis]|uniref:F-box domain-containing protein n=1 Tax=Crepidotus variabilis TaxID=179855 RepID=A0A9P6ED02_9AGAR|nr:hypothetical protein CPB83DRAFT_857356 [Crepidotus variabilis]